SYFFSAAQTKGAGIADASAVASAVAPNSRRVCLFFIVVFSLMGALISHSGATGNSRHVARNAAIRRARSVQTQVFAATATRPGTGALSSLRAERPSSRGNLRPADPTASRT